MNYYLDVWRKFATFSGRARRSEYWMFTLFNAIVYGALLLVDALLGTNMILALVYILAGAVPSLAVSVRRLHDTGKSGWWLLIGIIPLIGTIALLVFMFQDSYPGDNEYGPNPKMATAFA